MDICSIKDCGKKCIAFGYCNLHYQRFKYHGNPLYTKRPRNRICSIEGCGKKHDGFGYCKKHYMRFKKWGDPLYIKQQKLPLLCLVNECKKKHFGLGYCIFHYKIYKKYNLNPQEYENNIKNIKSCQICNKIFGNTKGTRIHIDHDHKTNMVRGFLCHSCNVVLGHCHDNIELFDKFIKYLNKFQKLYI